MHSWLSPTAELSSQTQLYPPGLFIQVALLWHGFRVECEPHSSTSRQALPSWESSYPVSHCNLQEYVPIYSHQFYMFTMLIIIQLPRFDILFLQDKTKDRVYIRQYLYHSYNYCTLNINMHDIYRRIHLL